MLKYRYSTDPDEYRALDATDFIDDMVNECRRLADDCEQEILEGGTRTDLETGLDNAENIKRFEETVNALIREIAPQAQAIAQEGEGRIDFKPPWAVAQRTTFYVTAWTVNEED